MDILAPSLGQSHSLVGWNRPCCARWAHRLVLRPPVPSYGAESASPLILRSQKIQAFNQQVIILTYSHIIILAYYNHVLICIYVYVLINIMSTYVYLLMYQTWFNWVRELSLLIFADIACLCERCK